ncbi:MAG TPA: 5'-nucleotidase C-terminal domain-containing protein, partial [Clostridia bacterium]|nr:5'-nucleotidase C-terminal domain-containing protein [Clostridia bacterium]
IGLTHVGLPRAVELARTLKGVDVVLSGDYHERTYAPVIVGNTWVVEPGSFGSFLGRLDLVVAGGKIAARKWQLIELRADRFPEDPKVKSVVQQALAPYRERMDRVIGRTEVALYRYSVLETTLDAVFVDALREAAGTEIALGNGFRYAAPISPGPITEADLWNTWPLNMPLRAGKVSGKQLKEFWEKELEHSLARDPNQLFGGWLPRVSGMQVRFAYNAPMGRRVQQIIIGGEPMREDQFYTVASCEREGDPPATLCRIPGVQEIRNLEMDAHTALRNYLARHSPIRQPAMGRIQAVDIKGEVRSQFFLSQSHVQDK